MNTTNINEWLKVVAQAGDINLLYTLIREDPHILENIDSIPFAETPLHIAASFGQLEFATEVMRLKPSFAWKLNQQGFCPIHLAMQHDQKRMVLRLVDINKDHVRVKGREGLTPLHLASQSGDADLLARFLFVCPDSIEDVTVRSETALHIAVKSKQCKALQVLVGWLMINRQKDAIYLESKILNWKDEAGNTILHVSTLNNNLQALYFLVNMVNTRMDLNAKNLENSTALDIAAKNLENSTALLDIATSAKMKSILCASGAKYGSSVTDAPAFAYMLIRISKIPFEGWILLPILRLRSEITEEQRNAFLVVAALIATAIFQTVLSPPGGVYQASAGDAIVNNNMNTTTSLNSTATATQGKVGRSVISKVDFYVLMIFSMVSFFVSTLMIYILTPGGKLGNLLFVPMLFFAVYYACSLGLINPARVFETSSLSMTFHVGVLCSLPFMLIMIYWFFHKRYKELQYHTMNREAKAIRNRNTGGINRW